jgi:hypothetical protein
MNKEIELFTSSCERKRVQSSIGRRPFSPFVTLSPPLFLLIKINSRRFRAGENENFSLTGISSARATRNYSPLFLPFRSPDRKPPGANGHRRLLLSRASRHQVGDRDCAPPSDFSDPLRDPIRLLRIIFAVAAFSVDPALLRISARARSIASHLRGLILSRPAIGTFVKLQADPIRNAIPFPRLRRNGRRYRSRLSFARAD